MALSVVTRGYLVGSNHFVVTRGYSSGAHVPTITVILTDANNNPMPNLSNLTASWWDQIAPDTLVSPVIQFGGLSTDSTGSLGTLTLNGSTLASGQYGTLLVSDSNNTGTQSPVPNVAWGPVKVS